MTRRACLCLGVLLATACTEGETAVVYVYDPYQGPPVFPNQRPQIELPASAAIVSNNGSDTLSVLDLATGEVVASSPVGRNPIDTDGPHHLAVDQEQGFVYVALAYPLPTLAPGPHAQHGLSARDGWVQKLALDDLRPLGEVRVDENPGDIVMSEDGSRVVVAHFDLARALENAGDPEKMRATVAVIDPTAVLESGSAEAERITTCVAPHGVALSRPDGGTAFVACYGEDAVAVVDLTDPSAEPLRVPVGSSPSIGTPTYGPYSAVSSPTGALVAIGNTESKDLRFFDTAALELAAVVVDTLGAPYFPAWTNDEAMLYIPTQSPDELVVADAVTGMMVDSVPFGDDCISPHEAVLSSDEQTLYVVCEGDHMAPGTVLAMDTADLSTRWTATVGVYPDRLVRLGGSR